MDSYDKSVIIRRTAGQRCGYTIAEVLVACGLMVLLAAIILSGLLFIQRSSAALAVRAALQNEANLAMLRIERDVDVMLGIDAIEENEWTLRILDSTTETAETIVYWFDMESGMLIRTKEPSGDEQTILQSLSSARFVFYDRQSETINPANVRRIAFEGILERSAGQRQVVEQLVTASFLLRNTMPNNL
jgi:type II secretory pathway component PulJ